MAGLAERAPHRAPSSQGFLSASHRILLSDTLSLTATSCERQAGQMLATGRHAWKEEMAPDPEGHCTLSRVPRDGGGCCIYSSGVGLAGASCEGPSSLSPGLLMDSAQAFPALLLWGVSALALVAVVSDSPLATRVTLHLQDSEGCVLYECAMDLL